MIVSSVRGDDRWATAELIAFGESQPTGIPTAVATLVARLKAELDTTNLTGRRYFTSRRWTMAS